MARRILLVVLGAWISWACGSRLASPSSAPETPGGGASLPRVLFIGNSLTEANNLPGMVESLANHDGPRITTRSVVSGGFSLEDHWNQGTATRLIDEGGWAFVVLQQGPSALLESRQNLREWTVRFDQRIRRIGAKTALYMVWPESFRRDAFGAVSDSDRLAAEDVNGLLFPVGEAWLEVWRRDAAVQLYGPDGFHPSPTATYLAALVIAQQITGRSPIGLPSLVPMSPATAALLQESAAIVNERFGRR